jgi:hypothetical protein
LQAGLCFLFEFSDGEKGSHGVRQPGADQRALQEESRDPGDAPCDLPSMLSHRFFQFNCVEQNYRYFSPQNCRSFFPVRFFYSLPAQLSMEWKGSHVPRICDRYASFVNILCWRILVRRRTHDVHETTNPNRACVIMQLILAKEDAVNAYDFWFQALILPQL